MGKNRFVNLIRVFGLLAMVLLVSASPSAAAVTAVIDINPDTVNLSGNGKWVTAYIELPEPYDAGDIAAGTVTLSVNGALIPAQAKPIKVGDYDQDGITDLMVKFDRQVLQSHLFMGPQTLTISGSLPASDYFEGSDTVKGVMSNKGLSKFTLLQTSDVHNHASGYGPFIDYTPDISGDDNVKGGFARLASLIGMVRQNQKAKKIPTLLFDSGDFFMGTTYDLTASNPIILQFFQAMKYDAVTLGNHEFDWSPVGLATLLDNGVSNGFKVPVVATNTILDSTSSGDEGLEKLKSKRVIVDKKIFLLPNGLKIGLLGLMGPDADAKAPVASPVTFNHDYSFIQSCVNDLRKNKKVDLVAVLSHGGVENDGFGDDADLSQNVSGIDIIASGHYHTATHDAIVAGDSNSIIFSPGQYGEFLSRLDVTYSKALGRVVGYAFNLLPIDDNVPGAPAVTGMVDAYNAEINTSLLAAGLPTLSTPISATGFDLDLAPFQVTGLGSLCADAIRNVSNQLAPFNFPGSPIDISIVPSGVIRDPILEGNTGAITFSDVYNSLPLGMSPYQTSPPGYPLMHAYLTGQEVYLMCEIGLTLSQAMGSDYYLNFSGIKIVYDPSKAAMFNGVQAVYLYPPGDLFCTDEAPVPINPFDPDPLYHIAVNLYALQMLNVVNSYLPPGYSIVPKTASGDPLGPSDYFSYRIDATPDAGVQELKEWMALLNYLPALGAVPPEIYGAGGAYTSRVSYVTP